MVSFYLTQEIHEKVLRLSMLNVTTSFQPLVLGELKKTQRRSLRTCGVSVNCLPCDQATASAYGKIKASLRAQGKPIPIWISAIAPADLTLLTRDSHFKFVSEIEVSD